MTVRTWSSATAVGDATVVDIELAHLRVELLSLGAAIRQVEVPDRAGVMGPVHLALPEIANYADHALNPHLGSTLGRYANRIADGHFTLDGATYDLNVNNGPNTLHGGAMGWDRHIWRIEALEDSADAVRVVFAFDSPDGDMGFPGAMSATATYVVSDGAIAITYAATTDAPTVISMANHCYWNLAGSRSIGDHELHVPADRRLMTDATQIPCGVADVEGTPYDLRDAMSLTPILDVTGGLDDCYLLDGDGMRLGAVLRHPGSGRILRVSTDAPGMQVYSGNNLRAPFDVHQSMSLEAQRLPDAPNQPDLGPCVLRPGQTYHSTTLLEFDVD